MGRENRPWTKGLRKKINFLKSKKEKKKIRWPFKSLNGLAISKGTFFPASLTFTKKNAWEVDILKLLQILKCSQFCWHYFLKVIDIFFPYSIYYYFFLIFIFVPILLVTKLKFWIRFELIGSDPQEKVQKIQNIWVILTLILGFRRGYGFGSVWLKIESRNHPLTNRVRTFQKPDPKNPGSETCAQSFLLCSPSALTRQRFVQTWKISSSQETCTSGSSDKIHCTPCRWTKIKRERKGRGNRGEKLPTVEMLSSLFG